MQAVLNPSEIIFFRLAAQSIGSPALRSAAAVVSHLGAMQAQDFPMTKWAIGIRSAGLTESAVNAAIARGDIIRTHALRPTWHILANADVDWLLKLTAPRIMVTIRSRHKQLGLDEKLITQCKRVIEKDLLTAESGTRAQLITALKKAKITLAAECYSHILLRCELDRLICSGPVQGSDTAYALYAQRIRKTEDLPRDEALARLALRYFTGHGPATLEDFIWWSGLKISEARQALAAAGNNLKKITAKENTWYLSKETGKSAIAKGVLLLPAFDEYIIGYADRSAVLPPGLAKNVISNNGIFRAVILHHGQVCGLWKKEVRKEQLTVIPDLRSGGNAELKKQLNTAAAALAHFYGLPLAKR